MSYQLVARRYASALAGVTTASGEDRQIQAELISWQQMIASSGLLQELLQNPTIPYEQKQKVLGELIQRTKVRETTANFLKVLLRNQRLSQLDEINRKFAEVLDERAGLVSAEVSSARPVSEQTKQTIQENLRKLTGRDVKVKYITNEDLIGGIVTRIGSAVYDGSIKNQLAELGRRLVGS